MTYNPTVSYWDQSLTQAATPVLPPATTGYLNDLYAQQQAALGSALALFSQNVPGAVSGWPTTGYGGNSSGIESTNPYVNGTSGVPSTGGTSGGSTAGSGTGGSSLPGGTIGASNGGGAARGTGTGVSLSTGGLNVTHWLLLLGLVVGGYYLIGHRRGISRWAEGRK